MWTQRYTKIRQHSTRPIWNQFELNWWMCLRAYSHLPCLVRTKPKKSLVRTFLACVKPKQPVGDPAGEVVSVRFQTNPLAVRLRCENDRARSDPVQKIIYLFGRNRLPLLLIYIVWFAVNSKISVTLSDPLKMSRGSTWSEEKTKCVLDIWADGNI